MDDAMRAQAARADVALNAAVYAGASLQVRPDGPDSTWRAVLTHYGPDGVRHTDATGTSEAGAVIALARAIDPGWMDGDG